MRNTLCPEDYSQHRLRIVQIGQIASGSRLCFFICSLLVLFDKKNYYRYKRAFKHFLYNKEYCFIIID